MSTVDEINAISKQIYELKERRAELQKGRPLEPVNDHELQTSSGPATLSSLFGDRSEMLLVHNMGERCSYCTMWADGLNGYRKVLEERAVFVVASPDAPAVQQAVAKRRDWEFTMVSVQGSPLFVELGFQEADGSVMPGVSALYKDEAGKIWRTGLDYFGPLDDYCPPWPLFALLKNGNNDWEPS